MISSIKTMESEPKSNAVLTGVDCEKRKFTWTIERFDIVRKSDDFINSQKFIFEAGETVGLKTDWSCKFKIQKRQGENNEELNWIGMYFCADKLPDDVVEINAYLECKIKTVGRDGFYFRGDSGRGRINVFKTDKSLVGWLRVIPKDAELKDLPLINGSLVVEIEITIYGKKPVAVVVTPRDVIAVEKMFQPKFTENLQKDLANLLDSSSSASSDPGTKIVSKDGVEFAVHRAILSARSSVFERMFQINMEERRTGVIQISELGSKTVAVLLRFIYTGTLHKDWSSSEVIVELVYSADKYQIQDLVEFLDHAIGSICRKETAGRLFNLAKKLGMKKAEKDLFEFMKVHMNNPDDFDFFANDKNVNDIG